MSYNYNKTTGRSIRSNSNNNKYVKKVNPKRVVLSRQVGNCSEKSCSTGIIAHDNTNNKPRNKEHMPRKTTKSDGSFSTPYTGRSIDYCKKCGDNMTNNSNSGSKLQNLSNTNSKTNNRDNSEVTLSQTERNGKRNGKVASRENGRLKSIKQYYKNENFQSADSLYETENGLRKISLDTINELPETRAASHNSKLMNEDCNVYEIYSDSGEEPGFLDTNDGDTIEILKKFRKDNYFECHSAKNRVNSKGSVTSLRDHNCVYRFYLNDRLFPVPLSSDHHDNVRCVECHLPMDLNPDSQDPNKANGTIQAKVKLGTDNDAQDMILFLPVKDSLIIKERRKQIKKTEDVMYFGVIKLDTFGNSVFNSTLPTDSLALKYQKGYKEGGKTESYNYKGVEKDDVLII